jgi:hypothetical protein
MTTSDARARMLAGLSRTRTLDFGGGSTVVVEAGDRARLLLLHDGIECGGVMWTPVLAQFVPRHRVVMPDIPLNT